MTFPANAYVYEFLYRGQPAGSDHQPAYHVIVGVPGTDGLGAPTLALTPAMTPEQAAAQGMTLPSLIEWVNTATTAQVTAAKAQVTELQVQLATATAEVATQTSRAAALTAQVTSRDTEIAALQAQIEGQGSTPSGTITFLQFMALFTTAEQTAIVSSADPKIKLFCLMASGAGELQLSNAEVVEGVGYLVSSGVITGDRAAQILAGTAVAVPSTSAATV